MKKITLILTFLVMTLTVMAQKSLFGVVVSKTNASPVELATIRLFTYSGSDSTLVQGTQADLDGNFIVNKLHEGKYKLIVSAVGFSDHIQWVEMKDQDINLHYIRLVEYVHNLAEVSVQGRAAEMTVKGDTIEYNTSAYQVAETATVEDLLKKMNGVEVDKEGKVTINGEEIKGVRIDGKKFFGDKMLSVFSDKCCKIVNYSLKYYSLKMKTLLHQEE
jgi:hypothetical protein